MLKFSAALAALAVANGMTESQINNMCYDFWNKLEESGVTMFDELNVQVGANINAGSLTSVGTGGGINNGRFHMTMGTTNEDGFTVPAGQGTEGVRSMNAGVGANVNLGGGTSIATDTGLANNQQGAVANIDLFRGDSLANMHIPGFQHMNNGIGNDNSGLGGVIHEKGHAYSVGNTYVNDGGFRRRLQDRLVKEYCAPPKTTNADRGVGGAPVTCASTGDPHIRSMKNEKFDHMAFGEFRFYSSWAPVDLHPVGLLRIDVRTGPYNGSPVVAVNSGVAISGALACGNIYEILKEGTGSTPRLKITRSAKNGGKVIRVDGQQNIWNALKNESCPKVTIQNGVMHFVFREEGDDRTTLRVQIVSYGLNLGLDVLGSMYRPDTDKGICTKNALWDMQLECDISLFSMYPNDDCNQLRRGGQRGGPEVACPDSLYRQAKNVCYKCPETVDPEGCIYDVCAMNDISAADDLLMACRVGVRLPVRMTVQTGVNVNMEGATAINVGTGNAVNYGVTNLRYVDTTG